MATQVSPGIKVSEIDKTLAIGQVALTEGAIAGNFRWGPVDEVHTVSSEEDLVNQYWKPDSNTADYFFTAANFLAYSNSLRVVRVVNPSHALAATSGVSATAINASATFTINTSSKTMAVAGANAQAMSLFTGVAINVSNATANAVVTVSSVTNSTAILLTNIPSTAVTSGNGFSYGLYVKNQDHYDATFQNGEASTGNWSAKYPGVLGNSLRVEICSGANAYAQLGSTGVANGVISANITSNGTAVTFAANVAGFMQVGDIITVNVASVREQRSIATLASNGTAATISAAFSSDVAGQPFDRKWKYASLFNGAPGTSTFASAMGGSLDEMHVVVVDEDGQFTGVAGTVLERFGYVSKAADAKTENGGNNYYKTVMNRNSKYVWWLDHSVSGTNWGSSAAGVTFDAPVLVDASSLYGGVDGGDVSIADLERGYDFFASEQVETSFVLGASANSVLATYIISNIVEPKMFSMAFFSPDKDAVVSNAGSEVDDIVAYRNRLPSTSYAVLDSGWKYQYDKYNDMYRYVPLNGDVAGCAVRTDQTSEAWFSPAGFSRGQIKNVVKLPFNPNQAQRDDLYRNGINPVVSFPGQGTVLYGDKTLLNKPSAFDRINVRRLFIVLEKTIKRSAEQQLFEQNDSYTRQAFVSLVEPYLRSVKGRRGITDFYVVCDETNNPKDAIDRGEFRADIYVKPIHSINFIALNFVAVRSDVAFNEVVTNLG